MHDSRNFSLAVDGRREGEPKTLERASVPALEIGGADLGVGEQLRAGAGHDDAAGGEHVGPVRDPQRLVGVLLDQQDGEPLGG